MLLNVSRYICFSQCVYRKSKLQNVKIYTQFLRKKLSFNSELFLSKSAIFYVLYWNENP